MFGSEKDHFNLTGSGGRARRDGRAGQSAERRCWDLAKAKVKSHFKEGVRRLSGGFEKGGR